MKNQERAEIFNPKGKVLCYIANNPGCTVREISQAIFLTPRSIWEIIGALRYGEWINIKKKGRIHHYTVPGNIAYPLLELASSEIV